MSHNFWLNQQVNFFPPWNATCLYLGWFLETCFRRDSLVGHILPQYWQERVKLVTCFASIWTDIAYLSRDVWLHSEQAYPEDPPALIILFSISSSKDPTCPRTPYFEWIQNIYSIGYQIISLRWFLNLCTRKAFRVGQTLKHISQVLSTSTCLDSTCWDILCLNFVSNPHSWQVQSPVRPSLAIFEFIKSSNSNSKCIQ